MLANLIESFIDESGGGRVSIGNPTSQIIAWAKLGAERSCATIQHTASHWWFGCACFV